MDFWNYATDVRLFIAAGIVFALCIGSVGDSVATLSIGVLILQMTASIHGMHIGKDEFHSDIKPAFISLVCSFVICTGSALLMGLLFMNDTSLWYGWVMLSAVPAGVSVVTLSLIMKGNMGMTMISMVLVYACALAITPLMTYLFIGDAISPLEILKYIVLFIGIPVLLNIPLGKVSIQRKYKVTFINFMMMLLVVLALGNNRDFIFAHLDMDLHCRQLDPIYPPQEGDQARQHRGVHRVCGLEELRSRRIALHDPPGCISYRRPALCGLPGHGIGLVRADQQGGGHLLAVGDISFGDQGFLC